MHASRHQRQVTTNVCSLFNPCARHKATRNILISVFLVACDMDTAPQKEHRLKTISIELPPFLSCYSLLSQVWVSFWFKRACGSEGVLVIQILQNCWTGVGPASTPARFIRVFAYNLTGRRRHPVWLFKNLKGRRCGVTAQRPRHDPLQHCRAGVGARGVQRRAGADK